MRPAATAVMATYSSNWTINTTIESETEIVTMTMVEAISDLGIVGDTAETGSRVDMGHIRTMGVSVTNVAATAVMIGNANIGTNFFIVATLIIVFKLQ